METTGGNEFIDRHGTLRLIPTRTDRLDEGPCVPNADSHDDEMSLQDQILSSWYLAGSTESGMGAPSELDFWRYAA